MTAIRSTLPLLEILRTANQALLRNWGRAVLTSISMVIGTSSLVLVIVAGISGRAYTLEQIQGVGTNLIAISNESADGVVGTRPLADRLNLDDLKAINRISSVRNVVALNTSHPTITEEGITSRVSLIGTTPEYQQVRNIEVLRGNFIDEDDERFRNKVCLVTEPLERLLESDPTYKGYVRFYGVQFAVIGVFRERVNTFGQTEISDNSAVIPLSVMNYFKPETSLDQIYVSAESMDNVPQVSGQIKKLLISQHRNQSFFHLDNLSEILKAANNISLGLSLVLLIIAAVSLGSSGISIMNIMLITVTERTTEIGIKKSIGASRRVILIEFLVEALMLSGGGGLIGVAIGVAVPYSVRFFTTAIQIQVPPLAIVAGFGVTLLVGLTFGMIPALRASRLNPVDALRYE